MELGFFLFEIRFSEKETHLEAFQKIEQILKSRTTEDLNSMTRGRILTSFDQLYLLISHIIFTACL